MGELLKRPYSHFISYHFVPETVARTDSHEPQYSRTLTNILACFEYYLRRLQPWKLIPCPFTLGSHTQAILDIPLGNNQGNSGQVIS